MPALVGPPLMATVMLAVAVLPVPPFVEVTAPVLMLFGPVAVPTTFTLNVPVPLGARVPPLKVIVLDPAMAVIVPEPILPLRPLGAATTNPTGKGTLNAIPLSPVLEFGLVIVKVRLV